MSAKVAVLVGSLRKGAFTRSIALALQDLAWEGLDLRILEIGDLPLYNPDLDEGDVPAAWTRVRGELAGVDAVLFITPEYNRTLPAALKNVLDVGSRPSGHSVWDGKPAGVISASPGAIGGFAAHHHLRQSLVSLNMPTLQQPEMYLSRVHEMLDDEGRVREDKTRAFLKSFLEKFGAWVALFGEK